MVFKVGPDERVRTNWRIAVERTSSGAIGAGAASYAMDATMDHIEDSVEDES